jgi:DNA polymerase-1
MAEPSPRLFIVDGHAHIYAAYYAPMRPLTSPSGEPTKAVFVFTTALLSLIDREKPDYLVVAMDSKTPSFRVKLYPEYKAHRPPMPEDMPPQIQRIEQILEAMKIPLLRVDGYEADDVIGTLAAKAAQAGIETYICSKDKDMLQLLEDRISTYDIKTGQRYGLEQLLKETGLTPRQFIDVLALQGDTADNIPGVPDVGPKTALQWIQQYGSLENLYAHADEIGGKRGENLRKFKDQVFLSRRLVVIDRQAPIELDKQTFLRKEADREKLAQIFNELGFTRLLTQLNLKPASAPAKPQIAQTLFPEEPREQTSSSPNGRDYILVDTPAELERFAKLLERQEKFSFDTETTSLDPMRAELVGLSFSWQAGQGWYLPVRAPIGQKHLTLQEVRKRLGPILADKDRYKIAQNMKYDLIVLENSGMPVALKDGRCFDTMVASYVLAADRSSHSLDAMARDYLGLETTPIASLIGKGKKQISFDQVDTQAACAYSAEDADVTWQLYEYLSARLKAQPALHKLFETIEMPLVEVLMRMEINGVRLDTDKLQRLSESMAKMQQELTERIYELAGGPFNIDSTKQLGEVLFDRLGLQSIKSGKTQRSTDADVLEQLADEHEIIPLIIQYRQIEKLRNTYTDKLVQLVHPKTGRIHASFNQTVTATGRLSSSDPNLQNIPVRTELGRQIRAAFVPEKNTDCILSADYSQIELRLLAHFSHDQALRQAFAQDQDIHRFVASEIYGVPLDKVTSEMRTKAKAVNFGIIYGQGPFGLARTTGISQAEAKQFIEDYFRRYPSIRSWMDRIIEQAKQNGYAETILHRRRTITGLESRNPNVRSQAQRLVVNTVIQGSAADLIKAAMIRIHRRIEQEKLPIKMILQIHDELVFELPKSRARQEARWIEEEMTHAVPLEVPLKVDVSMGNSWLTEETETS